LINNKGSFEINLRI